jgi:TolB-like protein
LAETGGEQQGSGARSGARAVFISYASQDKTTADAICELLENEGIGCWIAPRDVIPGEFYADAIVRALNEAQVLLLVLTEHAVNSPHVLREVERTSSKRHPIISLRIDTVSLPPALEYFLSSSHWLEANGSAVKKSFPTLIAAAKRMVATASVEASFHTEASTPRSNTVAKRSRWLLGSIAATAAVLIFAVLVRFWGASHPTSRPEVASTKPSVSDAAAVSPVSARSVAVLPFVDMSEKKDQEYFSDGLSEELIDRLAHAENLKVIARTSSFQFKGKNEDMRTIGQRLGVANLLEGSVRTSRDTIRVTAQLISVADGSHLWSETYDRKAGDVFKVQDEIATAVVSALKATMMVVPSPSDVGHSDVESHNKVLLARYFSRRATRQDSDRALAAIDDAIKINSENAETWLTLSEIYYTRAISGWMPTRDAYAASRRAVDRALALNPNLAVAHRALALTEKVLNNNDEAYRREQRRAVELDPSLAKDPLGHGVDAYAEGRVHDAVQLIREAAELNPLSTFTLAWYANVLFADNNLAEAERVFGEMLEIQPNLPGVHCQLGQVLLAEHKPDAALETMSKEPEESSRLICMPVALWSLNRQPEADALLAQAKEKFQDSAAYGVALNYAVRGDKDEAFKWLNRAFDNHDLHLQFLNEDPSFRTLHSDPPYAALGRRIEATKTKL